MNLTRLDSVTIARGDDIDVGTLFGGLAKLLYMDLDAKGNKKNLSARINTGFDRLMGGALMYATYACQTLKSMVDWEALEEQGVGVFAYDFLEPAFHWPDHKRKDFASFLLRETSDKDWYQISDNWMVPELAEMKVMIKRWAVEARLPLLPGDQSEQEVYTRKLEAHLKRFYGLELNDTYYEKPQVVAGLMEDKLKPYEAVNILAAESGLDRLDGKQGGLTAADEEAI
jgi:hypothetical protein